MHSGALLQACPERASTFWAHRFLPSPTEAGSPLDHEVMYRAALAGSKAQRSVWLHLITGIVGALPAFWVGTGMQRPVLMLVWQTLPTDWAVFLVPKSLSLHPKNLKIDIIYQHKTNETTFILLWAEMAVAKVDQSQEHLSIKWKERAGHGPHTAFSVNPFKHDGENIWSQFSDQLFPRPPGSLQFYPISFMPGGKTHDFFFSQNKNQAPWPDEARKLLCACQSLPHGRSKADGVQTSCLRFLRLCNPFIISLGFAGNREGTTRQVNWQMGQVEGNLTFTFFRSFQRHMEQNSLPHNLLVALSKWEKQLSGFSNPPPPTLPRCLSHISTRFPEQHLLPITLVCWGETLRREINHTLIPEA